MSDDKKVAASKREKMIAALAVDRDRYLAADNRDRAAEVEASIKALRGDAPVGRRAAKPSSEA